MFNPIAYIPEYLQKYRPVQLPTAYQRPACQGFLGKPTCVISRAACSRIRGEPRGKEGHCHPGSFTAVNAAGLPPTLPVLRPQGARIQFYTHTPPTGTTSRMNESRGVWKWNNVTVLGISATKFLILFPRSPVSAWAATWPGDSASRTAARTDTRTRTLQVEARVSLLTPATCMATASMWLS